MLSALTDDDGTYAGGNPWLSLNRGLANWGVNPRRWNRPLMFAVFERQHIRVEHESIFPNPIQSNPKIADIKANS